MRKLDKVLLGIGWIEILIGTVTLVATLTAVVCSAHSKPLNVLIFVIATASISALLGVGILTLNTQAYQLLIYFSSVIILSKILILAKIIALNGALETTIPDAVKNYCSILYHGFILFYLNKKSVQSLFIH